MSWYRWVGLEGDVLGMTTYGASGPSQDVLKHFGFTAENVVGHAQTLRTLSELNDARRAIAESIVLQSRVGRPCTALGPGLHGAMLGAGVPPARHYHPALSRQPGATRPPDRCLRHPR
jgi:hypothetical protein